MVTFPTLLTLCDAFFDVILHRPFKIAHTHTYIYIENKCANKDKCSYHYKVICVRVYAV